VNQCDSQIIRETLTSWGLVEAEIKKGASQRDEVVHTPDLVIINTCTVTGGADSKFRKALRRRRREHPHSIIGITGCYVGKSSPLPEDEPGADLVFRMGDFAMLAEVLRKNGMIPTNVEPIASRQSYFAEHTRAFLKIQDGCDCFCAYCIVPIVRPKLWSESPENVIAAISDLSSKGYHEVVLTGIHLGFFGRDVGKGDLSGLLRRIEAECEISRIRLSSIEINEVSDDIVELIADSEKFCRHLHLPLQSGNDNILGRMGRGYTSRFFVERAAAIRERIPDIGITTDIIVGFPGETDEQFDETMRIVEEVGFAKTHVFRFSPRPGTMAAEMKPRVPQGVISSRARQLIALGEETGLKFRERFVGTTLQVLAESRAGNGKSLAGFSSNYIRVKVLGAPADNVNDILPVRLTDAGGLSGVAEGKIV
jgi:threonylcarbamoyladenosine tRNA methylthiotransferase MtaB